MKAMIYREHGEVDRLEIADLPTPEPGPGEVLVRVRAAALNGFDPMMLRGETGLKTPFPMIPLGDFAGEVAGLGAGVKGGFKEGDKVTGYPILPEKGMMGEVTPGAACEYVTMPEACLVPMPDGVAFEDAAALPVAYGTAYRMMTTRGGVSSGERVLVLGAGGGVGVGAVQLAKLAGAEVVAAASSDAKLETLKSIGADEVLNTAEGDWRKTVYARFGKPDYAGKTDGGFDVLVNYIGGDTWAAGLKVVRKNGRILVCGASAGWGPPTDLRYIWSFEQTVIGSNGWSVEDQAALLDLVASGKLKPVLHAVRSVEELGTAMQELIDRKVVGKSVVTL
ncbi:MAG: quinone oxidoreductase family protein [Oceanicaulis sp.]